MAVNDVGSSLPSDADDAVPVDPQVGRAQSDYSANVQPKPLRTIPIEEDAGGAQVTQYKLKAVAEDTLTAVELLGGVEGAFVSIAKPWHLRRTVFEGETIQGKAYAYLEDDVRTATAADGSIVVEELVPPYLVDAEVIYAVEANDVGITGATSTIIDLNNSGHHFVPFIGHKRVKVLSIDIDSINVIEINEADATVGDAFDVAKPYKLQSTPWDGNTIVINSESIKYTKVDDQTRDAEVIGGTFGGDKERQIIVPRYLVGDKLQVAQSRNGTGVSVSSVQLNWMDLNIDARLWARSRVL